LQSLRAPSHRTSVASFLSRPAHPHRLPYTTLIRSTLMAHHLQIPDRQRIIADLTAGAIAAKSCRNAMSRPFAPKEFSHKSYVLDFIAADWRSQLRGALEPHCAALCYAVNQTDGHRTLRKG